MKEWHPSRNGDIKAKDVSAYHREKMWWICSQGHEWEAFIRSRLGGKPCPFCNNMMLPAPFINSHGISSTLQSADNQIASSAHTSLALLPKCLTALHSGPDSRNANRYERQETVLIKKPEKEILGYAQLRNFSAEGLMLHSDFSVSLGEFIEVRFDKPLHFSVSKIITTRVVWCRNFETQEDTESRFSIGVILVDHR